MEWKKRFALATISSYAGTILEIVTGLLVFRVMYSSWSQEVYGFWAFLWSVFAFGILLDFGLGTTIQKTVASRAKSGDVAGINRVIATVFWSFAGIGLLIFCAAVFFRESLFRGVGVPPEHVESFTRAYYVFFFGIAAGFPMGIFEEVLDGVQRVDVNNWRKIASNLLHTGVILYMLSVGAPFEHVMFAVIGVVLLSGVSSLILAKCFVKNLSIGPHHFRLGELRENLKFSVTAYLIIFSAVILTKTDQAVIAGMLGLGSVALYQGAFKVAQMLNMFAVQSENLISPAAAQLHSEDDKEGVVELLLKSSRFLFILATPCYALAAIYMNDLIGLLTGLEEVSREAWLTGQFLLAAIYVAKTTSSCGRRVMVMCDLEGRLLKISSLQAVLNLGLSITFARMYGVAGVALATLITSAIFGIFVYLPELRKFCGITYREYLGFHIRGTGFAIPLLLSLLAAVLLFAPGASGWNLGFFDLIWRGLVVALPYLFVNRNLIRSTWAVG